MSICLRRRDFIAGLGGTAAWPIAARAQQGGRTRRIGVLMSGDENNPLAKTFIQALAGLNWTDGRNVQMDFRGAGGGRRASTVRQLIQRKNVENRILYQSVEPRPRSMI